MKKVISLLLSIAMIFSMVGTAAAASGKGALTISSAEKVAAGSMRK